MAIVCKTKGFVFKREDKAEADRVFTLFTKDFGRVSVSGRAIRKIQSKLRGGIDVFFMSEIEFIEGRHQKTLTDAVAIEKPDYLKNKDGVLIAQKIASLLDIFLKGQEKDGELFCELESIFAAAYQKDSSINAELVYQYFFWNFLSSQGYHFNTDVCASCYGRLHPLLVYFSSKEGGVICRSCINKDKSSFKINADVVKVLRIILAKKWNLLLRLKLDEASHYILERASLLVAKAYAPENI